MGCINQNISGGECVGAGVRIVDTAVRGRPQIKTEWCRIVYLIQRLETGDEGRVLPQPLHSVHCHRTASCPTLPTYVRIMSPRRKTCWGRLYQSHIIEHQASSRKYGLHSLFKKGWRITNHTTLFVIFVEIKGYGRIFLPISLALSQLFHQSNKNVVFCVTNCFIN